MKRHLLLTTLGSLMLSATLIAHAQDAAAPAAEPTPIPPEATAEAQPAVPAEVLVADASDTQPAVAAEILVADASDTQPAVAAEILVADASATQPVAAAVDAPSSAPAETEVSTPAADDAILIVIDDTPLLDAIRNLARQAGINLIIDPAVGYGQTDGSGKSAPQPNVSIRWENITASQALTALLGNYGLQAVEDPKIHITRITVKDPAAPDPLVTKTIQLQYASPTNVMAAISSTFADKRSKVVADNRTSQLVVVTTEKEMVQVEELVKQLDTPTKQVLIEARLVETSVNPSSIKGINWSKTLGGGQGEGTSVRFGNNPAGNVTMDDGGADSPNAIPGMANGGGFGFNPAGAFLSADGLSATLSFLNTSADSKVLASPRTVTLDNEPAHIEAGTLYPIINVTAGTANSTGGSQVNYSNLTVRLDVTPRISANNLINLKVTPNVMRLDKVQDFVVGSGTDGSPSVFQVPVFATRNLDTRVMIPSGNTLVMGGLISDSITTGNIKVPILGDLPFIGRAFRQDSKERQKSNLIVFITPTIVQDEDFQPTKSDYLATPVPVSNEFEAEWTTLDTGHPADWSKPPQR